MVLSIVWPGSRHWAPYCCRLFVDLLNNNEHLEGKGFRDLSLGTFYLNLF